MAELETLYREVILEHNRRPRNFRRLSAPCSCTDGINALCGDRLRVCVRLDGDQITEVAFEGSGCAISMASASMMTEVVTGTTREQANEIGTAVASLLAGRQASTLPDHLDALAAVREFPSRVKCAALAWEALRAALAGDHSVISTENDLQQKV